MTLTNMLIAAAYPLLSKHYVDIAINLINSPQIISRNTFYWNNLVNYWNCLAKELWVLVFGKNFSPAIEPFFIQIWIILIIVLLVLLQVCFGDLIMKI